MERTLHTVEWSLTVSYLPASSSSQSRWLWRVAAAILILNLFDGIVTLALVETGLATEANPLMDTLLGHGAVSFMAFKIALVSLSVLLLWRLQRLRVAFVALHAAAAGYAVLALYHLRSIDALARFVG